MFQQEILLLKSKKPMAGIYVHIPYCGKLCSYCDFHFSVSTKDKARMVDAISNEIDICGDFFQSRKITTIYFGGGTPSFCTHEELKIIIDRLRKYIDFDKVIEFTFEANPEDLTPEYLMGLKELGINRLSIGIQSFNDDILKFFNRRHNAEKAVEAVKNAQEYGFKNITIDLIYGVNGFDQKTWEDSIKNALSLGVQHISAYHLTIDKGSVLGYKLSKGRISQIDDEKSQEQFATLHSLLQGAGYEHYEVSNFALKGFRSVHNSSYWKGVEYIGFGPSAHSYYNEQREWNISNNKRYIEAIEAGGRAIEGEKLSITERYNEYVMVSLRTKDGVDIEHIKKQFPEEFHLYFCKQAVKNEIVKNNGNRYYIEPSNFLLSDLVITQFIYTE